MLLTRLSIRARRYISSTLPRKESRGRRDRGRSRRPVDRNPADDPGAVGDRRFEFDRSAMEFDEGLDQRQAEPGPALAVRRVAAFEFLEDTGLLLRRDADAGVADRKDEFAVPAPCRERHGPAGRGKFDGVGDEVEHRLADTAFIEHDRPDVGRAVEFQRDVETPRPLPAQGQNSGEEGMDIDRRALQRQLSGLDRGQVENVVDQRQEPLRAVEDAAAILDLPVVEGTEILCGQDLGEADDGIERRAQLNAIIGFAEILTAQYFGTLNDRQVEYSRGILDSSQRLLSLINDILDLASIEAGQLALERAPVDVHALLAGILALSRERARRLDITLEFDCPTDIGAVVLDERRIRQAMFNLVSNAIKFTPAGGTVALAARRGDGELILSVSDTGIGIAPEQQARVFEKFERGDPANRQGGAGLGLSLVKSFVELHGGTVELESAIAHGTRVICRIPVDGPPGPTPVTTPPGLLSR